MTDLDSVETAFTGEKPFDALVNHEGLNMVEDEWFSAWLQDHNDMDAKLRFSTEAEYLAWSFQNFKVYLREHELDCELNDLGAARRGWRDPR